jgi:hypothetical protein
VLVGAVNRRQAEFADEFTRLAAALERRMKVKSGEWTVNQESR